MEPLAIVTEPTPSLRQRSRELSVSEITTSDFQTYLDQLIELMFAANGIGIASPQVGKNIRAVIVSLPEGPTCLINPEIIKRSETLAESEEGCLSVPNCFGIVMRHKRVSVRALNRHGRRVEFDLKNLSAFVVQHEVDHLDGILFIDKAIRLEQGCKKPRSAST